MKKRKHTIQISVPATGEEEWRACRGPLMEGWITQGPRVAAFEKAFAERHQAKYALATSSCTTGLHLILAAMGIGPGDEVIVPAFTWVATANAVVYCGATPVFADVDPTTNNLRPDEVARRLTNRTRAVVAVHLFGLCCETDAIRSVIPDHVRLIEDAACAAGASYKGVSAGVLGDAAAFSFHPRKSITTGEGGMITTNDGILAKDIDMLRNHGASISEEQRHRGPRPYLLPEFNLLGYNYRMTDLQGAVGLVQLAKLDGFIAERRKWATFYCRELADLEWLGLPVVPADGQHAWQSFITYVHPERSSKTRNVLMEELQHAGIATRPGTHAVHMLKYYADRFHLAPDDFPGARDCDRNTMAIPLHNRMKAEDYRYITDTLKGKR